MPSNSSQTKRDQSSGTFETSAGYNDDDLRRTSRTQQVQQGYSRAQGTDQNYKTQYEISVRASRPPNGQQPYPAQTPDKTSANDAECVYDDDDDDDDDVDGYDDQYPSQIGELPETRGKYQPAATSWGQYDNVSVTPRLVVQTSNHEATQYAGSNDGSGFYSGGSAQGYATTTQYAYSNGSFGR